jgi:ElaB/YqjD/DUF883 family membrane-anchored ribosome-binding protein
MSRRQTKRTKTVANPSAAAGIQGVIDSAEEFLDGLQEQQGEAVERVRERIVGVLDRAREQLRTLDVEEVATNAAARTLGFVRQDPWRAVAISALVVVGALLLRPRS